MSNNFFKSARPIWVEGRDREWNVTVQLTYNAKDLKNATLTMAGASFYQVYLDKKPYIVLHENLVHLAF